MIWVPYTKTNSQWIASKLLQGFFGAPIESLCEISVADVVCSPAQLCSAKLKIKVFHARKRNVHSALWIFSRR